MTDEQVERERALLGRRVEFRQYTSDFNFPQFVYRLQDLFAGVRRDIELETVVDAKVPLLRVYAPPVAGAVVRSTRETAQSGRDGVTVTMFGTGFSADRKFTVGYDRTIEAGPGEGKQLSIGVQVLVRRIRTGARGRTSRIVTEHELVERRVGDTFDTYVDPADPDEAVMPPPIERWHSGDTGDHGGEWESTAGIEGRYRVTVGFSLAGLELEGEAELFSFEKIGLKAKLPPGRTYGLYVLEDPPGLRVSVVTSR
jgi:hypothetical protein